MNTYYIPGYVSVSQSLTIYDGAVVKFAPGAGITVSGQLNTPASGVAVFTARDDDSIGGPVPGSTGQISGYYANAALDLYNVSGGYVRNLQFRYCQIAFRDYSSPASHYVQNCQFLGCYYAVTGYYTDVYGSNLTMCDVAQAYYDYGFPCQYTLSKVIPGSTTYMTGCSGGLAPPAVDPPGNVYDGAQMVTVTGPAPGVKMRYRLVDAFDSLYDISESDEIILSGQQLQVDGAKALILKAWKNGIPGFNSVMSIDSYLTKIELPPATATTVLEGTYFLPIDLGDYRFAYTSMSVLINGDKFDPSEIPSPWNMPYLQAGPIVQFDRLENGPHTVQAKVSFLRNDLLGKNGDGIQLLTPVVPVQTSSAIRYPDWNDTIGNSAYVIRARTSQANTSFSITVRDHLGTGIKTLSGQTDSQGNLNSTWNLTDYQGNVRGNLNGDPSFSFDITVQSTPIALLGWGKKSFVEFPSSGNWVVAAMDAFLGYESSYLDQQIYLDQLKNVVGGAATYSGAAVEAFSLYFTDGNAMYGNPQPYGSVTDLQGIQNIRNNRWTAFKSLLSNPASRNLYYNGHGFRNRIGGDVPDTELIGGQLREVGARTKTELGSQAFLDSNQMAAFRKKYFGSRSGYRFVFLDGCETGVPEWPAAFAIFVVEVTNPTIYQGAPVGQRPRPSAYVGWREPISVGMDGFGNWGSFKAFRSEFFAYWSQSVSGPGQIGIHGLKDSLNYARLHGWTPPGQGASQLWIADQSRFDELLFITGYSPIKFNEYNQKQDWQP